MKTTELRQLIKESIQEYIKEIDAAGNRAALEAKMAKTQEAIDLRKKKLNMEGLDEAYHDMMDKGKMKEMTSEIKLLEKSMGKYKKMFEKMDAKDTPKMEEMQDTDEMEMDPASGPQLEEELRAGVYNDFTKWKESFPEGTKFEQVDNYIIAKDTASKELGKWNPMSKTGMHVDDFQYKSLEERKKMTAAQKAKKEDIVKGMKKSKSFGKSKEEKAKMYATATKLATKESVKNLNENKTMNKQFLHMQKLAGLITESEYKQKLNEANYDLNRAFQESPTGYSYNEVLGLIKDYEDENILDEFKAKFPEGKPISKEAYYNFAKSYIDDMSEISYIKANWVSLSDENVYEKAGLV